MRPTAALWIDSSIWRRVRIVVTVGFLLSLTVVAFADMARANETELENPIPEPIEQGGAPIALSPVADGLTAPTWAGSAPGDAERLFVADQDGILWAIDLQTGTKNVFLDVSDRLVSLGIGGPGTYDERGFLGFAFHPDYTSNGLLYTYTSEPVSGPADFSTMPAGETPNHQSVLMEWQVPEPTNPDSVVDPGSAREVLRIDQPQFNHVGATLLFGPDEMLFISLGDGGAADDQGVGHVPGGNGQDPSNILGSILRIDPLGSNSTNGQYGIPSDNPFVEQTGFLDEIYAYGFRNPYRMSFDRETGDLYVADVGQNDIEEVDIVRAGGNYGWNLKEGSFCFNPNGADPGFVFEADPCPGAEDRELIDPIAEYDHDEGIAIVGGFVYRGSDIPSLRGRYVFGDFFHPGSGSGRLFFLEERNIEERGNSRRRSRVREREIFEFQLASREQLGLSLFGFGQDQNGEVYVLGNETGTPFGDTGVVLRMASGAGQERARNFRAHLSGDEEVPPVETRARGQAVFQQTLSGLDFELAVANIDNVFAAHIHCAPDGVNGPVGVTLFSESPPVEGPVNGVLSEGTVTAPDEDNACGWDNLADVVVAIKSGDTYVNVHTTENPSGEIRGQIRTERSRRFADF